jgi:hypothetical protein
MPGKIIKFEYAEVLAALEQPAKDKSGTFQEMPTRRSATC